MSRIPTQRRLPLSQPLALMSLTYLLGSCHQLQRPQDKPCWAGAQL